MPGAYAVPMLVTGVVPIVPVQGTGLVPFGKVYMTLSWDNYTDETTPNLNGRMRIWTRAGTLRADTNIEIPRGRRYGFELQSEDVAVSFAFSLGNSGIQNIVTALVEYE